MLNTNYLWIQYIQRKQKSFHFPAKGRKYTNQCILSTQHNEENLSKIPSFQQFFLSFLIFLVFLHANSALPTIIYIRHTHTLHYNRYWWRFYYGSIWIYRHTIQPIHNPSFSFAYFYGDIDVNNMVMKEEQIFNNKVYDTMGDDFFYGKHKVTSMMSLGVCVCGRPLCVYRLGAWLTKSSFFSLIIEKYIKW